MCARARSPWSCGARAHLSTNAFRATPRRHCRYPTYLDCLFPHHNEAAKGFEGVKLSANESKLAGLPTPSMPVKVTSAPASGGGGGGGCAIM